MRRAKLFKELVKGGSGGWAAAQAALQLMDSSPRLAAAAVQDTYKLLRTALRKLVKAHEKKLWD